MKNLILLIAFMCGTATLATAQTAQTASTTDATEQSEVIETTVLKVKGATCKTDLGMIVSNVQKLDGVKSCEVLKHGAVTTLEVSYDTNTTSLSKIQKTVLTTGTCENPDERRYQVKI
ncbi:MAG: outer membrane receptor for monomeric catechols [Saprospiraceae bacterium]|jgi:outer membrane receptor for monomeric catechols